MNTVIDGLRQVVGVPSFYVDGVVDYGAVTEYMVACLLVCVVVASVFKILVRWFEK